MSRISRIRNKSVRKIMLPVSRTRLIRTNRIRISRQIIIRIRTRMIMLEMTAITQIPETIPVTTIPMEIIRMIIPEITTATITATITAVIIPEAITTPGKTRRQIHLSHRRIYYVYSSNL